MYKFQFQDLNEENSVKMTRNLYKKALHLGKNHMARLVVNLNIER